MWRIWRAPNNAIRWQIRFNSAFKGLIHKLRLINNGGEGRGKGMGKGDGEIPLQHLFLYDVSVAAGGHLG
jgi:hypothetical protein